MTYNPEAKIQQFIKESVLEDKNINLNKLKEAKDSIDEITKSFEILEKEIMILMKSYRHSMIMLVLILDLRKIMQNVFTKNY